MTIRERIVNALHGKMPDRVPFTVYAGDIPVGATERKLRNSGLGMVKRILLYSVCMQSVKICTEEYWEKGRDLSVMKHIHQQVM